MADGYRYFYKLRTHKTGRGGDTCTGKLSLCDKNGRPLLVGL